MQQLKLLGPHPTTWIIGPDIQVGIPSKQLCKLNLIEIIWIFEKECSISRGEHETIRLV